MELLGKVVEDQLYLGHVDGPCSYLPDRNSSLLFIDGREVGDMYRLFLDLGYRRHGFYLYRPDCVNCQECRILRILSDSFAFSRSQKRVWRKCQNLFDHRFSQPEFSAERLELYQLYLEHQHNLLAEEEKEDRQLPSESDYQEFLIDSFLDENTQELQLLFDQRLVGLGIIDRTGNALSAVYFMFHPEFSCYSLGTYAILLGIKQANEWGLRYYYPGYYIKGCNSMNYKANYYPNEIKKIDADNFVKQNSKV